ncbi:MAG: hypothetical protein PHV74_12025 [Dehalococcoidia bacterium]|nr:hypothetical protein [Dehalococcoidia bacterium]
MSLSALGLDPHDIDTPLNLQFSVPYLISLAALGVKPGPDWYHPDKLTDSEVREFMGKVKIEIDPRSAAELVRAIREEPTKRFRKCPGSISVVAKGRTFDAETDYLLGDPHTSKTTMTDDRLRDKFRTYSSEVLPRSKVEKAIETVDALEKLGNVNKLVELLVR